MAPAIIAAMGWDKNNLNEDQKQTVSALATLAAGLAGGATVGAISAFTAEAAAPAIIKAMGWDKDSFTEKQKQTVSALATLAAGWVGR